MKIEKVIIVGLGSIGSKHLSILRKLLPNSVIKVMHHNKSKKSPSESDGYIKNISEAIIFSPQLVVISNPSNIHIKTALAFANKKINLFIEKPLSNNINNISKLISAYRKNNMFVSVGYNLRYLPSLIKFKALIDKKILGKLYFFHSTAGYYLPNWRLDTNYTKTVSANKNLGGGVLLELSHELDYVRWIFGEIDSIYSETSKLSNLKIDVEDASALILKFKKNTHNHKLMATIILDFLRQDKNRECTVIGEKGSLKWNGNSGTIELFDKKNKIWKNLYNDKSDFDISYLNQWKDIINRIKKNLEPQVDFFEGVKVLEIIEAAKFSYKKAKQIKINYNIKK